MLIERRVGVGMAYMALVFVSPFRRKMQHASSSIRSDADIEDGMDWDRVEEARIG